MLRGLLLDFYGTVVEDDDAVMAAIAARVAAHAAPGVTASEVLDAWNRQYEAVAAGSTFRPLRECALGSLQTVLDELGWAGDAADLCSSQLAFWRRPPLRSGTREFLERVELPICLVSDADRSDVDAALAHHGLMFSAVVTSDQVRAYKPDAAMFRAGLSALGLRPEEVLHIGDSIHTDVRGACAVGIGAVWVNRSGRPRPSGIPLVAEVPDLAGLHVGS